MPRNGSSVGDSVAAKGYRIGGRYVLLVTGRKVIGQEGNVDVSLANKKRLHVFYPFLGKRDFMSA